MARRIASRSWPARHGPTPAVSPRATALVVGKSQRAATLRASRSCGTAAQTLWDGCAALSSEGLAAIATAAGRSHADLIGTHGGIGEGPLSSGRPESLTAAEAIRSA